MSAKENRGVRAKLFEVRDRGTNISVLAVQAWQSQPSKTERGIWGRAGFRESIGRYRDGSDEMPLVIVVNLGVEPPEVHFDSNDWTYARTMRIAHQFIETNWDMLISGQVVDVRAILGEQEKPAISDYLRDDKEA